MLEKLKFFLKESVVYGVSGVLSRFATLITIPIYFRVLGPESFGLLDLYITIGAALFLLLELQIGSGFMRDYYDFKKESKERLLFGSVLSFYIVGYTFFVIFSLLVLSIFDAYLPAHIWHIFPIILALLPRQLVYIAGILLRLEHKAIQFLVLNLSHFFSVALFGVYTVYQLDGGVNDVLFATFYAQMACAGLAIWLILKNIKVELGFSYTKPMLLYGVPIVPAVAGGWIIDASGRIIIADQLGEEILGYYAMLVKIGMVMILGVQAFRMAWEPMMMKKMSDHGGEDFFAKSLPYYFIVSALFIVFLLSIAPFLVWIIGGDLTNTAWLTLCLLLMGYAWQGGIGIVAAGNAYKRKTFLNSVGSITGGGLCIIATYVLISSMGMLAAGLGFLIGMMISFSITYYFAQMTHKIDYDVKALATSYGVSVIVSSISILLWAKKII